MKSKLYNFSKISFIQRVQIIIILLGIWFLSTTFYETFIQQNVPVSVMNIYMGLPLEKRENVQLLIKNYNKLSVVSLDIITKDPDKIYENEVRNYLLKKNYYTLNNNSKKYYLDGFSVTVGRDNEYCNITISREIVGVFK